MNKIKISVLCPTRRRMAWMRRLVTSCLETCHDKNQIEVVFGIDDDDTESIETAKELKKEYPGFVNHTVWPRKKYIFSDLINQCSYAARGEIFNLIGDDAIFESPDWDLKVIEIFENIEDKIALVQTGGGLTQRTGHPFMHKNWREAVGHLLPPYFSGDWADWWLSDVLDIVSKADDGYPRKLFHPDITIRHLHPEQGAAEKDETYYEHLKERQLQEELSRDEHPYHSPKGKRLIAEEAADLMAFIRAHREKNESQT